MARPPPDDDPLLTSDSWGGETDWNLIRRVSGLEPDADADRAWLDLVERYRAPVQRSLRRCLRDAPAAEEAASDFFGYLFQKQVLPKIDRDQGRFRCYIQGVIRVYAKQWKRASSISGNGDAATLDVAADESETLAERDEEIAWAEAALANAFERLARIAPRDVELLQRIYGLGGREETAREELAREKGMQMNALHVALHRARHRLHEALREELRSLTSSAEDFEAEGAFMIARLLEAHPGLLEKT